MRRGKTKIIHRFKSRNIQRQRFQFKQKTRRYFPLSWHDRVKKVIMMRQLSRRWWRRIPWERGGKPKKKIWPTATLQKFYRSLPGKQKKFTRLKKVKYKRHIPYTLLIPRPRKVHTLGRFMQNPRYLLPDAVLGQICLYRRLRAPSSSNNYDYYRRLPFYRYI